MPTHKDLPEINELIDNQRQKDAVYAIRQENTNQKSKPRKQLMGFWLLIVAFGVVDMICTLFKKLFNIFIGF